MTVRAARAERVLCLVPARGGSKRLPGKNIAPLDGRPLLAYTLDAAHNSGLFDEIVVSTDDAAVAEVARRARAVVPFTRPAEHADDRARIVDVCLHALTALEGRGRAYDVLYVLQPTCPLRTATDIREAWRLFVDAGAPALVSVTDFDHPPFWALSAEADGRLSPLWGADAMRKTQELPRVVRPNGAIAIARVEALRRERTFYGAGVIGYHMPRWRSIDIDDAEDLAVAECLLEHRARLAAVGAGLPS